MYLSKQWSRMVGIILAVFLFAFLLHTYGVTSNIHLPESITFPYYAQKPNSNSDPEHRPSLPYRPQDEKQEPVMPSDEVASQAEIIIPVVEGVDSSPKKTIVMGKLSSEDTQWVLDLKHQGWDSAVYVVDLNSTTPSPTGLRTKKNKAKEALPYLTYIVDHYDSLPDYAVFMHAHRKGWPQAWHNDAVNYDAVNILRDLRLEAVSNHGFVNLRCLGDPGCPAEIRLKRNPPDETRTAENAYPYVYGQLFNMTEEEVREQVPVVATPCCAQFAVTREQVMTRPKSEYERFQTFIEEADMDDEILGTVMEYIWHIMFGREPVMCEKLTTCWKDLYGRGRDWKTTKRPHRR